MSAHFDSRELDYDLPQELIAQAPLRERDGARLLALERGGGQLRHAAVVDLPELLAPALLVLNDTRVIPARLVGRKPSGGKVELLLVERLGGQGEAERWRCMGRASKGLPEGARVSFDDGALAATVLERQGSTLEVELSAKGGVAAAIERLGAMPLPPYIRRAAGELDKERYQTVFAAHPGAVAAPTAGLHFSDALLCRLKAAGHELAFVTLHVGPGTFAPLRLAPGDALSAHRMHAERYAVEPAAAEAIMRARAEGRPVVAVGTTVVRALESRARADAGGLTPGSGATSLFIHPPFEFRVVDALLTNFHLPHSTLLALVMAFGGTEEVRAAYRAAVDHGYRFYSYGDAMLIR